MVFAGLSVLWSIFVVIPAGDVWLKAEAKSLFRFGDFGSLVKGYQGDDLTDKNTIMACVKHFACMAHPKPVVTITQ